jgi:hypothetical protein
VKTSNLNTLLFFSAFAVLISGYMGRFAATVVVVEREVVMGARYWKGLPARTLVFER